MYSLNWLWNCRILRQSECDNWLIKKSGQVRGRTIERSSPHELAWRGFRTIVITKSIKLIRDLVVPFTNMLFPEGIQRLRAYFIIIY